jgi:uncharacterized protein YqfB (UPF0267 family)
MIPRIVNIPMRTSNAAKCMQGKKTATSRPFQYGYAGDFFRLFIGNREMYFELTGVRVITLKEVAEQHFKEEGFNSPDEFKAEWRAIHPNKGYQDNWMVYFHTFKRKY